MVEWTCITTGTRPLTPEQTLYSRTILWFCRVRLCLGIWLCLLSLTLTLTFALLVLLGTLTFPLCLWLWLRLCLSLRDWQSFGLGTWCIMFT